MASDSAGSSSLGSRQSRSSGCRSSALSSKVTLASSAARWPSFSSDEGIHLDQGAVHLVEHARQAGHHAAEFGDLLGLEAEAEAEPAALVVLEAERRVERLAVDLLRVRGRDLLDVHAAFGRRHDGDAAGRPIEGDGDVELLLDGQALLDEQALHLLALGPGLQGDELHAEDGADGLLGLVAGLADLHAAALAAAAGVDLRLDHDDIDAALPLHARHRGQRVVDRQRRLADRHRDAEAPEQFLALILVDLHDSPLPQTFLSVSTSSRTARAELSSSAFSCSLSSSSITFSTPLAPSTHGTPMNRSL